MNVSNEQLVAEEAIVRALRATRANDAETAPRRPSRQTPQCPPIARFARAPQDGWTDEERRHLCDCPFCMNLLRQFNIERFAATAHEDTVLNVDTSQETHTGLSTAPGTKKSGTTPQPPARPTGQ
jgi:hypothetical protein